MNDLPTGAAFWDVVQQCKHSNLWYVIIYCSTVRSYEFEDNIKPPIVTSEHKTNQTQDSRGSQGHRYSKQEDTERHGKITPDINQYH